LNASFSALLLEQEPENIVVMVRKHPRMYYRAKDLARTYKYQKEAQNIKELSAQQLCQQQSQLVCKPRWQLVWKTGH